MKVPWIARRSNQSIQTETEDIKKRLQECTEELYKKDLHDPDNHNGMITHLESGILECEVKWDFRSITTSKASGGDGIPVELFQILKGDTGDCNHEIKRHFLLGRKAMTNLDSILKSRDITLATKVCLFSQSYGFSSSHVWM